MRTHKKIILKTYDRVRNHMKLIIKSYYKFAKLSYIDKQIERFEKVITEYEDFADRYPESKFLKDVEEYNNLSKIQIKEIQNEQNSSSVKR